MRSSVVRVVLFALALLSRLGVEEPAAAADDPVLVFSTYAGGRESEAGRGIAVDASGNIYITGETHSQDFPIRNARQSACTLGPRGSCYDVFLMKLAPGGELIYSTFFGGSSNDQANAIAVGSDGSVYIAGSTGAPTSAFVARFDANGALVFQRTFGSRTLTTAEAVAIDSEGNAWVTGHTLGTDFPATAKAVQETSGGGDCTAVGGGSFPIDAFVAKVTRTGEIAYASYLGGNGFDLGRGIAVGRDGSIYVTGETSSTNLQTAGAFQTEYRGGAPMGPGVCSGGDAFVARLDSAGSRLLYTSYLGGGGADSGRNIVVDASGVAYVAGATASGDFPVANAMQPNLAGSSDVFLASFDPAGAALRSSTYLGGGGEEYPGGLARDAAGNVYLAGATFSPDFPAVNAVQPAQGGGSCGPALCPDGFVAKFGAGGRLVYSTYLGGNGTDAAIAVAVGSPGAVYVAGETGWGAFPTVNAFQSSSGGVFDVFVARIEAPEAQSALAATSAASYFADRAAAPGSIVSAWGAALADRTEAAASLPMPTTLAGRSLALRDAAGTERACPLFYVSPTQINWQAPEDATPGPAVVTVADAAGHAVAQGALTLAPVAPGLFTANASGKGAPAGAAVRVNGDGSRATLPVFTCGGAPGTCEPAAIDLGQPGDAAALVLYGTGIRGRSAQSAVLVTIAGEPATVEFAGAQGEYVGLDQVNVRLPRTLAGRGDVTLEMIVDGVAANPVLLRVK